MEYNLQKFWIPMLYTENKPPRLKSHEQTRSWSHWPLPWHVLDKSCFLPHFWLSKFFHHSCRLPHGLVFKQEAPLSLLSAFCDSSANMWQPAYWLRTIQDSWSGVLLCGNGSPLGRDSNLLSPERTHSGNGLSSPSMLPMVWGPWRLGIAPPGPGRPAVWSHTYWLSLPGGMPMFSGPGLGPLTPNAFLVQWAAQPGRI